MYLIVKRRMASFRPLSERYHDNLLKGILRDQSYSRTVRAAHERSELRVRGCSALSASRLDGIAIILYQFRP